MLYIYFLRNYFCTILAKKMGYKQSEHLSKLFYFFLNFFFLLQLLCAKWKLDGVGPVYNRPSTDKLHHIFQKKTKKTKHLTRDT